MVCGAEACRSDLVAFLRPTPYFRRHKDYVLRWLLNAFEYFHSICLFCTLEIRTMRTELQHKRDHFPREPYPQLRTPYSLQLDDTLLLSPKLQAGHSMFKHWIAVHYFRLSAQPPEDEYLFTYLRSISKSVVFLIWSEDAAGGPHPVSIAMSLPKLFEDQCSTLSCGSFRSTDPDGFHRTIWYALLLKSSLLLPFATICTQDVELERKQPWFQSVSRSYTKVSGIRSRLEWALTVSRTNYQYHRLKKSLTLYRCDVACETYKSCLSALTGSWGPFEQYNKRRCYQGRSADVLSSVLSCWERKRHLCPLSSKVTLWY